MVTDAAVNAAEKVEVTPGSLVLLDDNGDAMVLTAVR